MAVPEIYALPALGDRVALNITDALIGQYEGGARGLLHYSSVLNQLWFSRDPVALDTLAIKELDRERRALDAPEFKPQPGALRQRRPAPTRRERPRENPGGKAALKLAIYDTIARCSDSMLCSR